MTDFLNGNGVVAVDGSEKRENYAEAFPSLGGGLGGTAPTTSAAPFSSARSAAHRVKRNTVSQAFHIPREERRYAEEQCGRKGKQEEQQKCGDVMKKHNVLLELNTSKDSTLTVIVTGRPEDVELAKSDLARDLKKQAEHILTVPNQYHRFIRGREGKTLARIETDTSTKIFLPRPATGSDTITINGPKDCLQKADQMIRRIVDEQSKLSRETVQVPRKFLPFVVGPNNANLEVMKSQAGGEVRINIPPPQAIKPDDIVVQGDRPSVEIICMEIRRIVSEKTRVCTDVQINIKKSQHRHVIGPRGVGLADILEKTGVSVEVPPQDSESDLITLVGEADKLGPALTMVYTRANSVVEQEIPLPVWLFRGYVAPLKGDLIKQFSNTSFGYDEQRQVYRISGPPSEVNPALLTIKPKVDSWRAKLVCVTLKADPKFHSHIIGTKGGNIRQLKEDFGVRITLPDRGAPIQDTISIEGEKAKVPLAEKKIRELLDRLENEKSRDIIIESWIHKYIIGTRGEEISKTREKFPDVNISLPDAKTGSAKIEMRGPKDNVDKCFAYLTKFAADIKKNFTIGEVQVFQHCHKNVIGRGGSKIREIREQFHVDIEVPKETNKSDKIIVTGKTEDVKAAIEAIEEIQKSVINFAEEKVNIPANLHQNLIGREGALIRSITEECGNVHVRFAPPKSADPDCVFVRGDRADVEKCVALLKENAEKVAVYSHTVEMVIPPQYHSYLIGRQGASLRKIREESDVRVVFPPPSSRVHTELKNVVLIGREKDVLKVQKQLEERIETLANSTEIEVVIDPQHHRHFVQRGGDIINKISEQHGGVIISFPRKGDPSDKVSIKGPVGCVDEAKHRMLEIVSELERHTTIDVVIAHRHHSYLLRDRGQLLQHIQEDCTVNIKLPDRGAPQAAPNGHAGEGDAAVPAPSDIIRVSGLIEDCEEAKAQLLALVPVSVFITIPPEVHSSIIGQKGANIRELMNRYSVNIHIPNRDTKSDQIELTGAPKNVEAIRECLEDIVKKNFELHLEIPSEYHGKLKRRCDQTISKEHNVIVLWPRVETDVVELAIRGYEADCEAAQAAIDAAMDDIGDLFSTKVDVDPRVHRRIIGLKGKGLREITEKYNVDITFPEARDNAEVRIVGTAEDVEEARDHLLNVAEEFLQDIVERAEFQAPSRTTQDDKPRQKQGGYTLEQAPAMGKDFFPSSLGGEEGPPALPLPSWGPASKK